MVSPSCSEQLECRFKSCFGHTIIGLHTVMPTIVTDPDANLRKS
nr:MAG TPA: hypothetical protein [Caudoviricetes sp.]